MTALNLDAIRARDAASSLDSLFPVYADRRDLLSEVDRLRSLEARFEALFAGGPDTPCRTTWREGAIPECSAAAVECVEVPMDDLRAAFGDES